MEYIGAFWPLISCFLHHLQSLLSPLHPFHSSAPWHWLPVWILTLQSPRSPGKRLEVFPWRARKSQTQAQWPNFHCSRSVTAGLTSVWFTRRVTAVGLPSPSTWTWQLMVRLVWERKEQHWGVENICCCFSWWFEWASVPEAPAAALFI